MVAFSTTIQRFAKKGEKTGWSYIEINERLANKLKPDNRLSFRVKGSLDKFGIEKTALIPMGNGNFILPFNASLRKGTGKKEGDKINVRLELDNRSLTPSSDFMKCLKDDSRARTFFLTLPKSHQQYFSKWIDSAKTVTTKTKRITMAVIALSSGQGFSEMIRANKSPQF